MGHGMLDSGYESERSGYGGGQEIPGMEIDVIDEPHIDLNKLMDVLTRDDRDAVRAANDEIMRVVRVLGGSGRKFKRQRDKALKAVVSEIYSPSRVTAAAKLLPEFRVTPGFALDLTTADEDGVLEGLRQQGHARSCHGQSQERATAVIVLLSDVHSLLNLAEHKQRDP